MFLFLFIHYFGNDQRSNSLEISDEHKDLNTTIELLKQRFPTLQKSCEIASHKYVLKLLKSSDGFVSQIPEYPIYEGNTSSFIQIGQLDIGEISDKNIEAEITKEPNLQEISGGGKIHDDDIRYVRLEDFKGMLHELASELSVARGKHVFSWLNTILDESGRSIDAGGKEFSFELWLQMLEGADIDFDESGQPILPTTVIHPNMLSRVQQVFSDAQNDPNLLKLEEELMKKKREAFYAKEANRKLVD